MPEFLLTPTGQSAAGLFGHVVRFFGLLSAVAKGQQLWVYFIVSAILIYCDLDESWEAWEIHFEKIFFYRLSKFTEKRDLRIFLFDLMNDVKWSSNEQNSLIIHQH